MSKHLDTVQAIYAAFGRGDVPAILAVLAEDIAWEYQPQSTDVPWLAQRNGRASVAGFFETLMKEVDIKKFEPKALTEGPRHVVALCDFIGAVRRTGREIVEIDEPHVWTFDDTGRITRFRHAVDTHAHWKAWQR